MTDELVKRLRYLSRVFRKHDVEELTYDDYLSARLYPDEAADRIEALTAERDHAWAMVANADTQMGQSLADYLQAKVDNTRLREALEVCVASIEHADMSDGVCCCGEEIEGHSDPMHSGHTPVDMGEYHAARAIEKARAALKGESHE